MNLPTRPLNALRGNRRRASLRLAANGAGFAALLFLLSCTHDQVWVASGESIATIGTTYDAVGAQMDRALDAKRIDEATYRRWVAFCRYYRPLYDTARDRWLHSDDTAAQHAAAVLAALAAELTQWGAVAAGGSAQ